MDPARRRPTHLFRMTTFLLLAVSAALLLVLLVHGPVGAAALIAYRISGPRTTTATLEKSTWVLGTLFMALCLVA